MFLIKHVACILHFLIMLILLFSKATIGVENKIIKSLFIKNTVNLIFNAAILV